MESIMTHLSMLVEPSIMNEPRMVIVVNMAVDMGIGRLAAQIAHAATMIILQAGEWKDNKFSLEADSDLEYWAKENRITKIVVKVWGEDRLRLLQEEADKAGLRTALMVEDDGQITALAIGPSSDPSLDRLTRHLPLM
jgi:PTH2 family peptidyl-tRNA hydrolase